MTSACHAEETLDYEDVAKHRRGALTPEGKSLGVERALCFLTRENLLRKSCILLASSKYFEWFIIFAILSNSVLLGISDYSVVKDVTSLEPVSNGTRFEHDELKIVYSLENDIIRHSELPFTVIFTIECLVKIIAMGFVGQRGTYLRDPWNILDFVVVLSSLVTQTLDTLYPNMPNVSAIRTIRVLRPLRSLSVIPGMRRLISALLKALPKLANVVVLLLFVFFIFGVLGVQLFNGGLTRRCRLTPYPVKMPYDPSVGDYVWPAPEEYIVTVQNDPSPHICHEEYVDVPKDDTFIHYYTEERIWNEPQPCFWPINEDDTLLCAPPDDSGNHKCYSGTTCGSDYDYLGNRRFQNERVMDSALHLEELNWGITNFDNIGSASLTIFQSVTQEGWTQVMYMIMDSSEPLIGILFFIVLLFFASFFVMNLLLAVISEEFNLDEGADLTKVINQDTRKEAEPTAYKATEKEELSSSALYKFVSHTYFSNFIMIVILLNTMVLMMDYHGISRELDNALEMINFVFSIIFIFEMVIKLLGLGPRKYVQDAFNTFDAFVVIMGTLEMITTPPTFITGDTESTKAAVSALRCFRLFRVFKLARNWRSLRELLAMIARAVASIANFAVLLLLMIYIYALIGLQLFANTLHFDEHGYVMKVDQGIDFWRGEVPRNNFDSLLWSCLTVFQVITGENWNTIMYDGIRANGAVAGAYFISLIIFGDFILMNLFLALLLDNFSGNNENDGEKEDREEGMKQLVQKMSTMKVVPEFTQTLRRSSRMPILASRTSMISSLHGIDGKIDEGDSGDEDAESVDLDQLSKDLENYSRLHSASLARQSVRSNRSFRHSAEGDLGRSRKSSFIPSSDKPEEVDEAKPKDEDDAFFPLPPQGKSLLLFPETNRWRQKAFQLISHPWFDSLVLVLIIFSSLALAVDDPIADEMAPKAMILKKLDLIFNVLFLIEMLLKVFALGLVWHKDAYLRNSWNILDSIIVMSSMIMMAGDGNKFKFLRSLRTLRTLRPLRMISRRPGLRLVVNSLIEAIPAVVNVSFVSLLIFLIFSIVAVTYLKGTYYRCQGDVFESLTEEQQEFLTFPVVWTNMTMHQQQWFDGNASCIEFSSSPKARITSRYICECFGAEWGPSLLENQNFDNVGYALMTFFEISTTEGWADVMMAGMDATEVDMQPIVDYNKPMSLFFVAFIFIGSFFVVNLLVGVIIDNFNRMKAALGGDFLLTPEQRKWIEAQRAASRVGPVRILKPPKNPVRKYIFMFVRSIYFEWFIMGCIIGNTLLMATMYFGVSSLQQLLMDIINYIFAAIFTVEAILKLFAFGWAYFEDAWNKFDFFVVSGTLVSIIVERVTDTSVRTLTTFVRIFRVTRILRLVKASKSIRQIMLTLYIALPGLSNIASILFLLIFIFATMGVQLFATVELHNNIDSHANFQNFGMATLFLLRAATGESWNNCMHDLATSTPDCVNEFVYDPNLCDYTTTEDCVPLKGCGNLSAYVYFCLYTLLVTYVMLNLTIAVILEGFSSSHEDDEPLFEPELLDEFRKKWAEIDPRATGFVSVLKLKTLINILEPPLGRYGTLLDKHELLSYMSDLDLPLYEGERVLFKDVLLAMAREMVKEAVSGDPNAIVTMASPPDEEFAHERIDFFAHEYFAVVVMQRSVVDWLRTKRRLEKQYMEEYKNKIKKPSGRPKKVRDARVYTIA